MYSSIIVSGHCISGMKVADMTRSQNEMILVDYTG